MTNFRLVYRRAASTRYSVMLVEHVSKKEKKNHCPQKCLRNRGELTMRLKQTPRYYVIRIFFALVLTAF